MAVRNRGFAHLAAVHLSWGRLAMGKQCMFSMFEVLCWPFIYINVFGIFVIVWLHLQPLYQSHSNKMMRFKNLNPKFCIHRVPDSDRLPTSATLAMTRLGFGWDWPRGTVPMVVCRIEDAIS